MIKALLFDFSRTLLFPKDVNYRGELNSLYRKLIQDPKFDFLSNYQLNEEMLIYLGNLKVKYKLYVFTSGSIQDAPEIRERVGEVFEKVFSGEEMMISKKEPESYKKIAELIGLPVSDILFIDDSPVNVQAAGIAGLSAVQYKDNKSLMNYIDSLE
ncbi:MAG: HAD-IA family hydrolase [Candidatus Microgenomates bacterium]|jgi:HAD superfamily hydrolase (TIGR01509 family)